MAWYSGHLYVMRRLAELQEGERDTAPPKPEPDPRLDRRLDNDMVALLERANVEAGIYPVPADHDGSLLTFAQPTPGCLLYPRKQTCSASKIDVCFVPIADMEVATSGLQQRVPARTS
jgi:hypothetical protein